MSLLRGIVLLTVSNAVFLGSGYIVQVLLGRFLAPEVYGLFGVLIYIVNIVNTIFASGFLEGVSRSIAQRPGSAYTILKKGVIVEIVLSGVLAILYAASAPLIARLFHNPEAMHYIAFSALLIPLYGIRTVYIGFLNGLRRFGAQSIAVMIAAVIKVGLVAVFIALQYDFLFILIAYFFAALGSLIVGVIVAPQYRERLEHFDQRHLFKLAGVLSIYASLFPLLTNIDLLFIKGIITDGAVAGYYNAATTLARFPQFLFGSFGSALLPVIAAAFAAGRLDDARRTMQRILRYGFILLTAIAVITILTSGPLIRLIYTDAYTPAIQPFSLLVVALSGLALVQVLFTTLISIGAEHAVLRFTFLFLGVDAALLAIFTPLYGMNGAASATLITTGVAFITCLRYLQRRIAHTILTVKSLARIGISATITGALALFLTSHVALHGWRVLAIDAGLFLFYLGMLALLREVTSEELHIAVRLFKKTPPTSPA